MALNQVKIILRDEVNYANSLSIFDRIFHIFWLLGPFFLLIERSPADAWLSICGVYFLVRSFQNGDFTWLSHLWVKTLFAFWFVCLISASFSKLPFYSLGEAFIWFRFPLFAFSCCFWFAVDKRSLTAMYMSLGLSMLLMSIILLADYFWHGGVAGRLTWPYGDKVSGNYLAKVSMPVFCVLVAIVVSSRRALSLPSSLLVFFTMVISVLTGERLNLVLRCSAAAVASICWRPKFKNCSLMASVFIVLGFGLLNLFPWLNDRFIVDFVNELPISEKSPYFRIWLGGIHAFFSNPLIGIGPDNYRMLCIEFYKVNTSIDCHTHPHNFYVQILAETGIIGLISFVFVYVSMTFKCINARKKFRHDVVCATAFVVPLSFFFPMQSTADFFGQWNNIFMWTALGVAMSACYSRPYQES